MKNFWCTKRVRIQDLTNGEDLKDVKKDVPMGKKHFAPDNFFRGKRKEIR